MFYFTEDSKQPILSRVDALLHEEPCRFYFYDKEFQLIPWQLEPNESLQELYLDRALQIRQNYDYIILAYSGGHDSQNILETFYYNNIPIDEILTVGAFSQDSNSNSDENHNKEIYSVAIPTLKKLHLPSTKITLFDYTILFDNIENIPLIKNYGSDWIKHIGSYYSVHNLFWNNVDEFLNIDKNKKTAIIFGCDKPNISYDKINNEFFTRFVDTPVTSYGNIQDKDYFFKEDFYISLNSTTLMRKQLHILKRFIIENCINSDNVGFDFFYKNYSKIVNKLLYNLNNKIEWQSPKSRTNILSLRDRFLLKNKNTDIYKIYLDGIKKLPQSQIIKPESFVVSNAFFNGQNFLTRKYII